MASQNKPSAGTDAANRTDEIFDFPCSFPIKVMGRSTADIHSIVCKVMEKNVKDFSDKMIKVRPSKGDKFIAITATIIATSKAQLDAIYLELNGHPDVMMTL